jgi:hypothetical protein
MPAKKDLTPLTQEEEELACRIGFDEWVLQRIKAHHFFELRQLTVTGVGADHHLIDVPAQGFTCNAFQQRAELIVRKEREPLARKGYRIFLSELEFGDRAASIAVIRGSDQYDILRTMRTEDVNGDKTTDDVIARLKDWEQRYPFNIWGANDDWVLAKFLKVPDDMLAFAHEVIAFAPDEYSQADWESEEEYARFMRRKRGFFLWWD